MRKNGPLVTCNGFPGHIMFFHGFSTKSSKLSLSHLPLFGELLLEHRQSPSFHVIPRQKTTATTTRALGEVLVIRGKYTNNGYIYRGEEWKTRKVPYGCELHENNIELSIFVPSIQGTLSFYLHNRTKFMFEEITTKIT